MKNGLFLPTNSCVALSAFLWWTMIFNIGISYTKIL